MEIVVWIYVVWNVNTVGQVAALCKNLGAQPILKIAAL